MPTIVAIFFICGIAQFFLYLSTPCSEIVYSGNMKYSDYFDDFNRKRSLKMTCITIIAFINALAISLVA